MWEGRTPWLVGVFMCGISPLLTFHLYLFKKKIGIKTGLEIYFNEARFVTKAVRLSSLLWVMLGSVKTSKPAWTKIPLMQIELFNFHEINLFPSKYASPGKAQVPVHRRQGTVSSWEWRNKGCESCWKQQCSAKWVAQPTQDFPLCWSYDNTEPPTAEAWETAKIV